MVSIWEKETFFAPQDVIVIGSGFVGLWSALWLVKENPRLRVTVIDRGLIPTGASTRNAGFACFGSLSELAYDIKTMGTEKTLELVELRYRGLERIQKYFKPGKIDFERCGGYELFTDCQGMESSSLQQQMDYLNALLREITGAKRTYRLADTENDRFGFAGVRHLVLNKGEGYLHSGKLLRALLREVHARGVQVLNRVEVLGYERSQKGFRVHTNSEAPLETEQILICTNAFAKDLLPEADIVPARGQVLLTSPIEGLQ
ncbi:MAG TPA: FAD-dependent oxidoreductase, partial [Chitinophagaceae bacterium]|nr:FAD-dependent oxidoreductase [Chitinophagaceae bacterium]